MPEGQWDPSCVLMFSQCFYPLASAIFILFHTFFPISHMISDCQA